MVDDKTLAVIPGIGMLQERVVESPYILKMTVKENNGDIVDLTTMVEDQIRVIAEQQLAGQPELVITNLEITDAARGEVRIHVRNKNGIEIMKEAIDADV